MNNIEQMELEGKRVFLRVDFNVPLDSAGKITDDNRIRMVLPTIRYALDHGACLALASHMGRPKGERKLEFSLRPAADRLGEILGRPVDLAPDCIGPEKESLIREMKAGDLVLLENLRFHPGETKNDESFARELSLGTEVFINDAFAACHRAHASVAAIVKFYKEKGAGFLLRKEMETFEQSVKKPERPFAAIIGGAKVSDKLGVLDNLINLVDILLIGGAMANTFLRAQGYNTGKSLVEEDLVETAAKLMKRAESLGKVLLVPTDAVTGAELSADTSTRLTSVKDVRSDEMILDIGPDTVDRYKKALVGAKTIVWNGPVGAFELEPFSKGTFALVDAVAASSAFSVIGGGDTGAAVARSGKKEQVSYISTGGGAFLELLEGKTLPGVAALEE